MLRKRSKLTLSKDTVLNLMPNDMRFVAGGLLCNRATRGAASACDCSDSATASGTCGDCSTIQY